MRTDVLVLDFKIDGIAKLKKRQLNAVLREALKELGEYWIDEMLPKHFTKAGAREYGYTPRKGEAGSGQGFKNSYTAKKLRDKKHTLPMVYTGETRQIALSQSHAVGKFRGNEGKSEITIVAPGLNRRHPNSKIRMQDEVRKVSSREIPILERVLVKLIEKKLTAAGEGRSTTTATLNEYGG